MKKSNLTLIVVTPMFSHGYQYDIKKANGKNGKVSELEFRVSELKAGMRYWWRASHVFNNSEEMYKAESDLFGNTEQKSPLSFRLEQKIKFRDKKHPVNGCNFPIKGICQDQEIPLIMSCNDKESEGQYLELLKLTSILGALGQRARKGHGSFIIKELERKPIKTKEELIKEISRLLSKDKGNSVFNMLEETGDRFELKETVGEVGKYPYIKKILIGDPIDWSTFSSRIHDAVTNTRGLDYGQKGVERFASPVHVTAYRTNQSSLIFPVVTILNNTLLDDNKSSKRDYQKYISEYEKIID